MNNQKLVSEAQNYRFKQFGLRGDLCLWLRFIKKLKTVKINSSEHLKGLVPSFYESETGYSFNTPSPYSGDSLLVPCDSDGHYCRGGFSEGVCSRRFWQEKVPLALDEIFNLASCEDIHNDK